MPNWEDFFPSKYVASSDLKGQDVPVVISHWRHEEVGDGSDKQMRLILYFRGMGKGMVVNKTNAKTIVLQHGPDVDQWIGRTIVLYSTMVQCKGGEIKPGIRVRESGPYTVQATAVTVASAPAATIAQESPQVTANPTQPAMAAGVKF